MHYDDTDVFILQLAGSKVWSVHGVALPFARTDETRIEEQVLLEHPTAGVIAQEYTMRAGAQVSYTSSTLLMQASVLEHPLSLPVSRALSGLYCLTLRDGLCVRWSMVGGALLCYAMLYR